MQKSYQIGNQKYIQHPIVLGQLNLLTPIIAGVPLRTDISPVEVIAALAGKLPNALAVVLIEDGLTIRQAMSDEALVNRAEDLSWSVGPDLAVEVISDFFECNPISSISEKIGEKVSALRSRLREVSREMISNGQFSSSAGETSPGAMESSGQSRPDSH